jgi:hypothetical protein
MASATAIEADGSWLKAAHGATHWASVLPHPQEQRAWFAACSALRFSDELIAEKSTTGMASSPNGTQDVCDAA